VRSLAAFEKTTATMIWSGKGLSASPQRKRPLVVSWDGLRGRGFAPMSGSSVMPTKFKVPCSTSLELRRAIEDIYSYPLRQAAIDTLNRQLRSGISDADLVRCVVELREEGRLCVIHEEEESQEPRIICSLGLANPVGEAEA
jgi:hypothetical protein